jgi:ankyrin repeat protein
MNLHEAIKNGNTEAAINLINDGADIHAVNELGETPLHKAAPHVHTDVVNLLLDRGADINAVDRFGNTALHMAAAFGGTEVVNLLIDRGANIHAVDRFGSTVLHKAAPYRHTEVFNLLLDRGANIHAVDRFGSTVLHMAAWNSHTNGHTDVFFNLLLDRGANIHAVDRLGNTVLHRAAAFGGTEVVNLLIQRGANIEASNQFGQNALHKAAYHNMPEVVETLVDHGANIDAADREGITPLMCAIEEKHLECIIKLAKESTKEFIELSTQNDSLIEYLKEQYIIASSDNTRKSGITENIENFINYITKTKEQKRIDTSMRSCAKGLFGQETTLKAKALLKIKIGALRSGVKDAYIMTLKFLHVFTKFNLLAENINHIIGFVGLYDAPVDLNAILSDLGPKLSSSILGECRTPLALNQCGTDIKYTDTIGCCTIS